MHKYRIMAPGPVELPPSVLSAGSQPMIHHRTPQFRQIFKDVSQNLKHVFMTEQSVLVLSAGGTGGMEACIANLTSPGETILTICGGVFGERWAKIGESLQRKVIRLEVPWGYKVDPLAVAACLKESPEIALVCGTLSETSTGVIHPIKELAKVVNGSNALFAVDAISGLVACEFFMDEWGVDAVVAGTQKGFMCPPGLALIGISEKAIETMKSKQSPKFYWSFEAALKSLKADALPDTPWTPNVSLVVQLHQALELILKEGLSNVWDRHLLLSQALRSGIEALGLKLFSNEATSPVVTVIRTPEGVASTDITKKMLNDWGISIIAGQGKIKQEVFRIGHVGYCDRSDVLMALAVLEVVLKELQIPISLGSGVKATQEVFLKSIQRG